ncbi:DUF2867 domain-containing protein [Tahibacter amnicola]|uniref:DUF2867 domain-containing protein n=1 Tax=Tahibacter amnicola TaxID=2976241 RepID=A0ABY6BKK2_9GAMM|nr:DUF2867 domain-containing protein [Tahibacter amnicola]UXI70424.1 DUF2867 domain-containing protein [Tahibacter amnicola]
MNTTREAPATVLSRVVQTFPSTCLPSESGGLPVEVSLIAQLGPGAGDHLYHSVTARQKAHDSFVDALDEPSARLGGMDLSRGDPTSLYTFAVGAKGHPFHRHAGHRVFTAISGSGGAQLRFSSATREQVTNDPASFVRALRYVDIPPDCLFTVRFSGETWHQFAPLRPHSPHPAFFALSCHTNELGGDLPEPVRAQVLANAATIPDLTELLPQSVATLLQSPAFDPASVPRIALSLTAPAESFQSAICKSVRRIAGTVRAAWSRRCGSVGFLSRSFAWPVVAQPDLPAGTLLAIPFRDRCDHQDLFHLDVPAGTAMEMPAAAWLEAVLDGFLSNPPPGVSRLMALRNRLVRPLGLRTSPLGCPVSSLLGSQRDHLFAGRFPVLDQRLADDGRTAEVLLGADDKHLRFRSCVSVSVRDDGSVRFALGTRVQCRNLFGRFYMGAIDRIHRSYIAPTMLRMAVDYVLSHHAANAATASPRPRVAVFPLAIAATDR